jgi:hypothetical protein
LTERASTLTEAEVEQRGLRVSSSAGLLDEVEVEAGTDGGSVDGRNYRLDDQAHADRVIAAIGGEDTTTSRAVIAVQGPQARESGLQIVVTAHAIMRKFEQPDELGSYDRWELKLEKKTSALVREWADIVLFANYKTYVVNVDNQGAQKGKNKAQGGTRMMYTTHHPCWDAKNRHDLPAELPFDFSSIASVLVKIQPTVQQAPVVQAPAPSPAPSPAPAVQEVQQVNHQVQLPHIEPAPTPIKNSKIPKALLDLMEANDVTEENIQQVVAQRGYYPANTPIENYDIDFINGSLVGAWPAVYKMIQANIVPFNVN